MNGQERAAFRRACKEAFRPLLEADVYEAEVQLRHTKGEPLCRADIIRDMKCRAPEAMARLIHQAPKGLPSKEELSIRFEVFREVMDELEREATQ